MFFEDTSLRILLDEEIDHVILIEYGNPLYKYCNALIDERTITQYVIYDCEYDRWLCLNEDGDVEFTTQYDDEDITCFYTEEDAENMICDESDAYAVQVRYYLKE